jgi:hypothetical protein
MLEEGEIPMARSITYGEYNKLEMLNRFVTGKYGILEKTNIDALNSIMARMRIFVEASWSGLRDDGYYTYDRLYAVKPSRNNEIKSPYAEISVGFYLWKKRKRVHERYISLGIECKHPKLYAWGGWMLGREHPEYDSDSGGKYLKRWTLPQSRRLFEKPLPDALKEIQPDLEKCLRQFKKSRYYKS